MDELHMKKALSTLKCALCGQHYKLHELKIIGHRNDLWFLNVHCISCGSRGMMAVVIKESHERRVINDLLPTEQEKFRKVSTINSNDILEIHDFLKEFGGDFISLFTQK